MTQIPKKGRKKKIKKSIMILGIAFSLIFATLPVMTPRAHAGFNCSNYEHYANSTVEGCVVDSSTAQPISGIYVYVLSCGGFALTAYTTTDNNGHFLFTGTSPPICLSGGSIDPVVTVNGVTTFPDSGPNVLGRSADNPAWGQWASDVTNFDGNGYGTVFVQLDEAAIRNVPVAGLYSNTGFATLSYSTTTSTSVSYSFSGSAIVTAGFSNTETDSFTTGFAYPPDSQTIIAYPYYVIDFFCNGSSSYANIGSTWSCAYGVINVGISGAVPSSAGGQYIPISTSEYLNPSSLPNTQSSMTCPITVGQGGTQSMTSQHDLSGSSSLGLTTPDVSFHGVTASLSYSITTSSSASSSTAVSFSSTDSQSVNFLLYPASGTCPPQGGGQGLGSFGPELHVWDTNPIQPDFSMPANPSSLSIILGGIKSSTLTLTGTGAFNGQVSLTWTAPSFISVSFSNANPLVSSAGVTSTASITVGANAPCGTTYPVTITGTNSQFKLSHSITIQVAVVAAQGDFCFSANQNSTYITGSPSGGEGTQALTINIQSSISANIAFTASPPAGLTATFNPTTVSVAGGGTASTSLAFWTSSSPPNAGTYSVAITATSGSISHSITVSVFYSGDYSLTSSTLSVTVSPGSSATVSISANSLYGFSGNVWLSAPSPGDGITTWFSYNPITPPSGGYSSSTTVISAPSSASAGTYTVTVSGNYYAAGGGSIWHQVAITVNVYVPCSGCGGGGGGGGGPPKPTAPTPGNQPA